MSKVYNVKCFVLLKLKFCQSHVVTVRSPSVVIMSVLSPILKSGPTKYRKN